MEKTIKAWGWFHSGSGKMFTVKMTKEESDEQLADLTENHPEGGWPDCVIIREMSCTFEV